MVAMVPQVLPDQQVRPDRPEQRRALEHLLLQPALLPCLQAALLQPKYSLLQFQPEQQDQPVLPDLPVLQDLQGQTQLWLAQQVLRVQPDRQVRQEQPQGLEHPLQAQGLLE